MEFIEDQFFVEQIFLQLKTTIERIKYHEKSNIPMLKKIKNKYPNAINISWAASNMFETELKLTLNDNEVAFLALHIGGAMERGVTTLTACIVCDYGVGISQLLKEKIERAISDLRINEVFSNRDIRKIRNADCDFVISTLPLKEEKIQKEVIVVEHLVVNFDIKNIESKMKEIRKNKFRTKRKSRNIEEYIKTEKKLINKELIYRNLDFTDKNELLTFLCERLKEQGFVTNEFKLSVFERESSTSTEVGHGISLPHGYGEFVNKSTVAIATLKKPIVWEEDEMVDVIFLLAFNLEDMIMKKEIIKFYKSFVIFLDNEEAINEFKKSEDVYSQIRVLENC